MLKLISVEESSGPVFLITALNPLFMEVLWTFSDMLATLFYLSCQEMNIDVWVQSHHCYTEDCHLLHMRNDGFFIRFHKVYWSLLPSLFYYKVLANFEFPISLIELFYLHCFASTSLLLNICCNLFSLSHINLPFSHWISFCYFLPIFLNPLGHFVLWLNKPVHGLHERRGRAFVGLFLLNHSENCTLREGFITFNYLARIY